MGVLLQTDETAGDSSLDVEELLPFSQAGDRRISIHRAAMSVIGVAIGAFSVWAVLSSVRATPTAPPEPAMTTPRLDFQSLATSTAPCDTWWLGYDAFQGYEGPHGHYLSKELFEGLKFHKQILGSSNPSTGTPSEYLANKAYLNTSDLRDCMVAVGHIALGGPGACERFVALEKEFKRRGFRHVWAIFGEEELGCNACPELFRTAPLAVRNYYHKDCNDYANVATMPLGLLATKWIGVLNGHLGKFSAEELPRSRPSSQRKFDYCFASEYDYDSRPKIVEHFRKHSETTHQNFHVFFPGKDPQYLPTLCNSKFSLAPRGRTMEDTWRLYESIFCGAIPIVTDGGKYFSNFIDTSVTDQFITIGEGLSDDDFDSAFQQIDAALHDDQALDVRQKKLVTAYAKYWDRVHGALMTKISSIGGSGTLLVED